MKKWMVSCVCALVVMSGAANAYACSEELRLWVDAPATATTERVVFRMVTNYGEPSGQDMLFELRPIEGGEPVAGALAPLGALEAPEFYAFVPEQPLAIGGDYRARLVIEGTGLEESFDVAITADTTPGIQLGELNGRLVETIVDMTCCSTEAGGCFDSCGLCYSCWPSAYEYRPELSVAVSASEAPVMVETAIYPEGHAEDARTHRQLVSGAITLSETLEREPSGGETLCVSLRAIDPGSLELISMTEVCMVESDLVDVDRRTPDFPDAVAECAEPPDDEDDENWQRYGLGIGGCSSVGGVGETGFGSLVLLALVLGVRRKRSGF